MNMEIKQQKWDEPVLFEKINNSFPFKPDIYRHAISHNHVTIYKRFIPQANIAQEKQLYHWRYLSDYPLVKIYSFKQSDLKHQYANGCIHEVFVQANMFLLQNLTQISIQNILTVFRSCLYGMTKISQKFGYFTVTKKMIMINFNGNCKVWMNENFQQNRVAWPLKFENQMIKQLLKVLQYHVSPNYKQFFSQAYKKCTNFPKSFDFLTDFTYQNRIFIPTKIHHQPKNNASLNKYSQINHKKFNSSLIRNNSTFFSKNQFNQITPINTNRFRRNLSFAHPNQFLYKFPSISHTKQQKNLKLKQDLQKKQKASITNLERIKKSQFQSTNQSLQQIELKKRPNKVSPYKQKCYKDKMKDLVKEKMRKKSVFYQISVQNNQNTPVSEQYEQEQIIKHTDNNSESNFSFIDSISSRTFNEKQN